MAWIGRLYLWGLDAAPTYGSEALHLMIALLIWAAVSAQGKGIVAALGSKPLLALGEWSFGIYLMHIPVIWFWLYAAQEAGLSSSLAVAPSVALTLLLARYSFMYIEVPARLALTRQSRPPSPAEGYR